MQTVIQGRLQHYLSGNQNGKEEPDYEIPTFRTLEEDGTSFTKFVNHYDLSTDELVILLLSLVPHIYPQFFEPIIGEFLPQGGDFPEFGGIKGLHHRGLIPTGETALFILCGRNLDRRFNVQRILLGDHIFSRYNIIRLEESKLGEPIMSGRLLIDQDYLNLFTMGYISIPKMSASFPAQHLTTKLEWSDMVLNPSTAKQLKDIEVWVRYNPKLFQEWGMERKLKPGFRALFYGPPGTGKTLAANLIGKNTGKPIFRVDLSQMVSKYIGETEKNLSNLFDKAKNKDWILFFDEADAIFGKRTNAKDAHDKYANQEVSYLLQRIEDFPGLTILASNFKGNIDAAFLRRFNACIFFPLPQPEERIKLWKKAFPAQVAFSPEVNFNQIAQKYEVTGANIMNIVHFVCLQAMQSNTHQISLDSIEEGILKEFTKVGKQMPSS